MAFVKGWKPGKSEFEIRNKAAFERGRHYTTAQTLLSTPSPPPAGIWFTDLLIAWVLFLSFFSNLSFFQFYLTEYSYSVTMTGIRLCSFKSLVASLGIAIFVLMARRNFVWKNSPSTKEWSAFYQELALQLTHSKSTPVFYDMKSGFVLRIEKKMLCKAVFLQKTGSQYSNNPYEIILLGRL